jgi:hypothetical protein
MAGVGIVMALGEVLAQQPAPRTAAERRAQRYQIAMMEGVLERAVEHGATLTRDRLQAVLPAEMLLTDNARARGFRLEGYGVFFDVVVPGLEGALPWSFRTMDQNDLGLASALSMLRSHIQAAKDDNLDQALKRIELQVTPLIPPVTVSGGTPVVQQRTSGGPGAGSLGTGLGGQAAQSFDGQGGARQDSILNDPDAAYQTEVRNALMDAMLDYSRGLNLAAAEWLGVGARGTNDRPPLGPANTDAQTVIIQVRGADLNAFLGGQISKEEARKRIEVKVF